jgi:transcriptional regulator with XRE-family HTH domain
MMQNESEPLLEKYIKEYASDPEYVAEGLAIKITEEMLEHLEKRGKSQTWLAEKMGVSRARISSILNAQPNMTLLTIARIAVAIGTTPDVCIDAWGLDKIIVPTAKSSEWNDAASEPKFEINQDQGNLVTA